MAKASKGISLIARSQIVTGYNKSGVPQGYNEGDEFEADADVAESLIKGGFAVSKIEIEEAEAEAEKKDGL